MKQSFFKTMTALLAGAVMLWMGLAAPVAALTAGDNYTVVVYKVNSDGSSTSVSSTSATADANGKISFDLSSLPTASEANFIFIEVEDSAGTVVRRAFVPAPLDGATNEVGINTLSDVQAQAIETSMSANSSDDPLAVAFGLVFVRSPDLQSSDISILADMMGTAILGTQGMKQFLLDNGVSTSQMATFQSKMVANAASGTKDMSDYMAFFKTAVDNDSTDEMAKAGSIMGDIFMDAALEANIDPGLILAAFDAAGGAPGLDNLMMSLSSSFATSVQQAVTGFFTRIAGSKMKADYSWALDVLNASGSEVTRFNTAVQTFLADQQSIDAQFNGFFMDPAGYAASVGKTEQQIQAEIDAAFQTVWGDFQSNLQSTNAEITTMRESVEDALGLTRDALLGQVGTEYDFNGTQVNWPIPQTVSVAWVASLLNSSGDFSYTRDTLSVPSNMQSWLDSDDDFSNGVDGQRHDFTALGLPPDFAALMGLMEDVQIVEHTRFALWDSGQPTQAQMEQARLDYITNLATLAGNISGTTDGATAISADEKDALIKTLQEPSLF